MSGEFMWGVITHAGKRQISAAECKRMDAACKAEGGTGFVYYYDRAEHRWRGWFTGPNRGNPFDQNLARAVGDRLRNPRDYGDVDEFADEEFEGVDTEATP